MDSFIHPLYLILGILGIAMVLFIKGPWRYDIVAMITLALALLFGVVPFTHAFSGFANPAVVTVACVMVLSQAIRASGVLDYIIRIMMPVTGNTNLHILTLALLAGVLSAFMNNVGALALMMPVALKMAQDSKLSPSKVLMPLAFASILGGLTTVIGTPPNILISSFREQTTGQPYAMFAFAPVGVCLALLGILYVAFLGWRFLPERVKGGKQEDLFQIQDYIAEIKIPEDSVVVNMTTRELEGLTEGDFLLVGLIRGKNKRLVMRSDERIHAGDIIIVEASHQDLQKLLQVGKLELAGGEFKTDTLRSDDTRLAEAVVAPGARIESRSSQSIRLRSRYQVNLLALSRNGRSFRQRLHHVSLRAGDVALLQGNADTLQETIVNLGFLPLAERGLQVGIKGRAWYPIMIFAVAISLVVARLMPVQVAFMLAVLAMVLFNLIPVRAIYEAIEWPVIVLLGCLIPVGQALQTTGGSTLIAHYIVNLAGHWPPYAIVGLILVLTMTLSDVMNNAATAVVMAPIAVTIAQTLGVNTDTFLMAVAVGASCSFLTPIGHQNNTLVMGPGGYQFQDYLRLGVPIEIIVIAVGLPMLLMVWPLYS